MNLHNQLPQLDELEELDTINVPWTNPVSQDIHVVVYRDGFPVTPGHLLFVPRYNTPEVLQDAFYDAYNKGMAMMANGECDGFNIGLNIGTAAGQTVMYPHIHLIPRYKGDVEDPTGGIRNVIPGKGNYRK
jgi:diadenosine tetraphosphate (Ap4A) HIT family hydrolase